MNLKNYINPLTERYGSKEMLYNFSPHMKFTTWRKLWLALAETQRELGFKISEQQLSQMRENINNIDFQKVAKYEENFRHDVMAHIHAFGDVAPKARPIIHLGVTSAFVGDNTDLIQIKKGLKILRIKLVNVLEKLMLFCDNYKSLPTLGFTHYQPAQLTTVGKRATLWAQSLLFDLEEINFRLKTLRFRGVKGTTGTAATFEQLFTKDYEKVKYLDDKLSKKFGFSASMDVTGQTYDRKVDSHILHILSNIAQSAHKFSNDIRLLQNLKEIEEPFEKNQIGSSAMAYKRNPMRSERIGALAKFVISLSMSPAQVAASQWLERTLDDSANKRLSIPQAFIAIDAILLIWNNIMDGLVVYENIIKKHIMNELPFMATEAILMEEVNRGKDRQEIHEIIRSHSMEAARQVKIHGSENDLINRLAEDKSVSMNKEEIESILSPNNFIGFAKEQTQEFIEKRLIPILDKYRKHLGMNSKLKV